MDNLYDIIKKADKGDDEARYNAALFILHEAELDKSDTEVVEKAFDYLRRAAMNGYFRGVAALELGEQYFNGHHIKKDYQKAIMWFRTSIQKKHPIAYYHLGRCFLFGHGVLQDYAKAFDSFFKGALTGYINNVIMLGDMYKQGKFVDTDYNFSAKLFFYVLNTEQNFFKRFNIHSDTYGAVCLRLGECYINGHGVNKDKEKSKIFLYEAKKHSIKAHWVKTEEPCLIKLLDDVQYPAEDFEPCNPQIDKQYLNEKSFFAEEGIHYLNGDNVEKNYLAAYFCFVKCLLIDKKKIGSINKSLISVYKKLECFENDRVFINYCREAKK